MKHLAPCDHQQCCEEACLCGALEHPRYFPRQLITPTDLTLEHTYFRDKLRRHNRLLHGWGVVCGALVCPLPAKNGYDAEPWKVRVKAGYILGPYGDEIVIACEKIVDLRTPGLTVICADTPQDMPDPWCSEVFVRREAGTVYVAVKYEEIQTRPVRVQPLGCECNDTACEYSRLCDGYQIGILSHCPQSHQNPPAKPDIFAAGIMECPDCPTDPWVVLAKVVLDEKGVIQMIDNCACRRMVISLAPYWTKCVATEVTIDEITIDGELTPGAENVKITITGTNFSNDAEVDVGPGLAVKQITITSQTEIELTVDVSPTAKPGPRTIRVMNPDCTFAVGTITIAGSVTVVEEEERREEEPPKPKPPRGRRRNP